VRKQDLNLKKIWRLQIAGFDLPITSDEIYYTTSYNLLNAKAGIQRKILKRFEIDAFFGLNNITGIQYPFRVFVTSCPMLTCLLQLEANYFGGVNVKYNFLGCTVGLNTAKTH